MQISSGLKIVKFVLTLMANTLQAIPKAASEDFWLPVRIGKLYQKMGTSQFI